MAQVVQNNLDYLAARIHGRHGELAEAERLDALCQLRTIPELTAAVFPEAKFQTSAELQHRTLSALVAELAHCPGHLDAAGKELLDWMLVRFQFENLKVLLRAFLDAVQLELVQAHLVPLPAELRLDAAALLAAKSLEQFCDRIPADLPKRALHAARGPERAPPKPFFLEAALDRAYYQELLARGGRLPRADREVVGPLVDQEVNTFQLMLVVRGKFHYGLTAEQLLPLHVPAPGNPAAHFQALLAAPQLPLVATLSRRWVIDALPRASAAGDAGEINYAAQLEALVWNRFLRLANRAFRRSHMGLGAVVGYLSIRRVEAANLITLAEGIRTGLAPEAIRARLIPRQNLEATHV